MSDRLKKIALTDTEIGGKLCPVTLEAFPLSSMKVIRR
jgi:hypothetical protein